jgi:hypothetical protein
MSWITVVWSMNAAACLTLAAFYGAVWCKQRDNWMHLLFSCSAVAAAAISAFEREVHTGPTQGTIVHCRVPLETQYSVPAIS